MNNEAGKILLLIEGEKLEKNVFEEISKVYNLKSKIFCLKCNVFMLYKIMKEYEFNVSIKDILIERILKDITDEDIEILNNNKFAYTYLIMDFDLQHSIKNINDEIVQIKEMCEYFVDETDDTIGKLFINYPMMESIRDRDGFIDDSYINKQITITDFNEYKNIAGKSKLSSIHFNRYKKEGFDNIIKSNIEKAFAKLFYIKNINYEKYLQLLTTLKILTKQIEKINMEYIYILNTSIFIVVDYLGKKYFEYLFN